MAKMCSCLNGHFQKNKLIVQILLQLPSSPFAQMREPDNPEPPIVDTPVPAKAVAGWLLSKTPKHLSFPYNHQCRCLAKIGEGMSSLRRLPEPLRIEGNDRGGWAVAPLQAIVTP